MYIIYKQDSWSTLRYFGIFYQNYPVNPGETYTIHGTGIKIFYSDGSLKQEICHAEFIKEIDNLNDAYEECRSLNAILAITEET